MLCGVGEFFMLFDFSYHGDARFLPMSRVVRYGITTSMQPLRRFFSTCEFFPMILALLVSGILAGFSIWKFSTFGHDALDVAIYAQTVFLSASGSWFGLTIHPHSYLGDHVELFLVAVVGAYKLVPRVETLLVLQSLALGASVIPFYYIARLWTPRAWARGLALMYVAYPHLWNIGAFEFHMLAFAPLLILCTVYAYVRSSFLFYTLGLLLMLSLREDMALVGVGLAAVALIDRRPARWWLPSFVLSTAWFVTAMRLTSYFSSYPDYKFWVYYQWLGSSLSEIAWNVLSNPFAVILHLLHPTNLLFYAGLLLPLAAISLLRPKWLLLSALPLLTLTLNSGGAVAAVLFTHHPAILLPGILLSAASSVHYVRTSPPLWLARFLYTDRLLIKALAVCIPLYSLITLTPLVHLVPFRDAPSTRINAASAERALERIAPSDRVAATLALLPHVSTREHAYSVHYAFIGHPQYAWDVAYDVPKVDAVLLETSEVLEYPISFSLDEDRANVRSGFTRLQQLTAELKLSALSDELLVFTREGRMTSSDLWSVQTATTQGATPLELVSLESAHLDVDTLSNNASIDVALTVRANSVISTFAHPVFRFYDASNTLLRTTTLPMAYGFFPTTAWSAQTEVTSSYRLTTPESTARVSIQLATLDGSIGINDLRSGELLGASYQFVTPELSRNISELSIADDSGL